MTTASGLLPQLLCKVALADDHVPRRKAIPPGFLNCALTEARVQLRLWPFQRWSACSPFLVPVFPE